MALLFAFLLCPFWRNEKGKKNIRRDDLFFNFIECSSSVICSIAPWDPSISAQCWWGVLQNVVGTSCKQETRCVALFPPGFFVHARAAAAVAFWLLPSVLTQCFLYTVFSVPEQGRLWPYKIILFNKLWGWGGERRWNLEVLSCNFQLGHALPCLSHLSNLQHDDQTTSKVLKKWQNWFVSDINL